MSTPVPIALVTGAASGIGHAAALALRGAGLLTVATARDTSRLGALEAAGCHTMALDVTDDLARRRVVAAVARAHGDVTVLVNNAGYGEYGPLETLEPDALRRQMETNVLGPMALCALVLPGMRAAGGGRIVNISSMAGAFALPGGGAYHASKHALEALSDALRMEVRPFGVDVVVVRPGVVRTPFAATALSSPGLAEDGGPYEDLTRGLSERIAGAYAPGARGALEPGRVARAVVRAATARRPRSRYRVGVAAWVLPLMRRLLPDRLWDLYAGGLVRPAAARGSGPRSG